MDSVPEYQSTDAKSDRRNIRIRLEGLYREQRRRRAADIAGYIRPATKILFEIEQQKRCMNGRRFVGKNSGAKRPRLGAMFPVEDFGGFVND